MEKDDVLVIKNNDLIIISYRGKRFIINKDHECFNVLNKKNIEEIIDWYFTVHNQPNT